MQFWDDSLKQVIGRDGTRISIPYLLSAAQVTRWQSFGFDVPAAADRHRDFVAGWKTAADFKSANRMLLAFYRGELNMALSQGVPASDPANFQIDAAPKYFQWEPAAKAVADPVAVG